MPDFRREAPGRTMTELLRLLAGTVVLRPYVFVFLAVYLVAAVTKIGWAKTAAFTFIAWAIITAIFVPKRHPTFPRRLDAYILVSALLFVAQLTAVVWVTGTQGVEEEARAAAGGGTG